MQQQVEDLVESTRRGELGENSIIAMMLKDRGSDGKLVRYGALYGHIVNLMIAGHETTAATLGFTLQLLAENPIYEERALEEVREVLQGRTEPSADDVPKLQFVEQCFREALRLYSPVTFIGPEMLPGRYLLDGGHPVYQGERIHWLSIQIVSLHLLWKNVILMLIILGVLQLVLVLGVNLPYLRQRHS